MDRTIMIGEPHHAAKQTPIAGLLAGLLLLACADGALAQQELEEAYRRRVAPLDKPNALLAADLFHDTVPEIIATDIRGNVVIIDGVKGTVLLQARDRERQALTAPVVGDFDGDLRLDIAYGTKDGRVTVLDSGTLETKAERRVAGNEAPFIEPPTVVSLPSHEDASTLRDVLIIADQLGTVYALHLDSNGQLQEYWPAVSAGATVTAPISVGRVRSQQSLDLAVPLSSGRILLIDAVSGHSESFPVSDTQKVATAVLLADFDGDGLDDLAYTLDNGDINVRRLDGQQSRLAEIIPALRTSNPPVGDPVLALGPGMSPREGLIFQAGRTTLIALRVADRLEVRGDDRTFSDINTELSVIPSERGHPTIVLGNRKDLTMVPTAPWFRGAPVTQVPRQSIGEFVSSTVAVITRATARDVTLCVVGLTVDGVIFGYDTDEMPLGLTTSPWMTRGATPRRNSVFDAEYFVRDRQRYDQLHRRVDVVTEQWKQAAEEGDWDAALVAAAWRRSFDPLNPEYLSDYRYTWVRKNLMWLILAGIALVALVAAIGYATVRFLYLNHLERRARGAVAKGALPEAEVLYERLHAAKPRNPKITATLAMVYMSNRNYEEKTIEVYRSARERDTENQNLLHCYARAMMKAQRQDADALAVYEAALKSFPEPPSLEYAIGMCHKAAGDMEEAAKRLRAALRAGLASDAVYSALCDVYLATDNRSAKALPIYRHQFPTRQGDQQFLEHYLDACIDGKQLDQQVESLCHMVLDGNPKYVPACCHLARIHIQRNELGRACEEVQRALEQAPDDEAATMLLAQCYLAQGRTDQEAARALARALDFAPEEPEILRTLADIHFRNAKYDTMAVGIYRRSHAANPNDLTSLKALAMTGRLGGDHELAIRSVEALHELGHMDPELTKVLAEAYIAANVHEPKAERVLRDALRAEPENRKFLAALARVLARQDNDANESIPIYETHLRAQPGDHEIGTQLVRAYIKNNRYEEALKTAQALLAKRPNDHELQRLIALSSLYDNKLDEAVHEYQAILERNPNDQEALFHLAMAYSQKGRTDDEAARLYQRALAARPESAELYLALGRVFMARGDAVRAVENYQQVLKVRDGSEDQLIRHISQRLVEQPGALRVRWFLCEVLVAYGRLREALDQLNLIFDENPNHARNILGALEKILAKDGQNVPALASKARILVAVDELEGARQALEKSYKLQPNSPDIMRALAGVYERILAQREDVEVRFRLGRVYYMMQEFDKAIGCFQKTSQDYRWEAESVKMLGKCFTNKGMLDLALQEFKKLVVDEETKELLYDLAQRYEAKKDLVGAKTVYRQLFAADIDYKDVKTRFEMLSGSTSDPMAFEKTSIVQQMSEDAKRRYELLDELGRGAMGIVYRARDKELEEVVALKILPDSMSNNPEAVRRFKIEARNARRLSHPNIVRIHDIGEEMGRKYISMEFVDGSDLKKKVRSQGRLPLEEIYHYGIQVADALAYAHQLGIVHRDIKPANIMLNSRDEVKITDFGIAKMLDSGAAEGTMMGAVIGTPLYMSPEQVQGVPVDNRADIYAYGVMLYELINGRPPFTEGDLAYQHIHMEPQRPKDCPDTLWAIIKKCLEKEKEARWSSAEEIIEALREARKESSAV